MTEHRNPEGVLWVCTDCTLKNANDDDPIDRPDTEPEVWALWKNDTEHDITMGILAKEHADDCRVKITGEHTDNYECECDRQSFSWSSCDGCGSTLGGERHAFTWWGVHPLTRS